MDHELTDQLLQKVLDRLDAESKLLKVLFPEGLQPRPNRETMDPGGRSFAQVLAKAARKEPTPLTYRVGDILDPTTREKLENIR